jgi:hypothetical protein
MSISTGAAFQERGELHAFALHNFEDQTRLLHTTQGRCCRRKTSKTGIREERTRHSGNAYGSNIRAYRLDSAESARDAKIANLDCAAPVRKHVAGLEIAMLRMDGM